MKICFLAYLIQQNSVPYIYRTVSYQLSSESHSQILESIGSLGSQSTSSIIKASNVRPRPCHALNLLPLLPWLHLSLTAFLPPPPVSKSACEYTGSIRIIQDQFSSVQSLSHVQLFVIPLNAAHQSSLSITNSRSLLKLMSITLVMPSNYLILFCPLLLLPSIFPNIRVFSNESVLSIRWPKYWSLSFSISPSNEYSGMISF